MTQQSLKTQFLLNLLFYAMLLSGCDYTAHAAAPNTPVPPTSTPQPTKTARPTEIATSIEVSHNGCVGVAAIRVLPGVLTEIKDHPAPNASASQLASESTGWLIANGQSDGYWHVCNMGWIAETDVTVTMFPTATL